MTSALRIRPAKKEDADFAASMIYLSLGHLADHLFQQNSDVIRAMIAKLFTRNAGRFGYQYASIAEFEKEPVGLLIASRGDKIDRLNLETIPHLMAVLGFAKAIGFIRRGIRLPGGREAEDDELYLGNLAILPSMQGRSFGSQLLVHAEKLARENNLSKCSLIVAGYNTDARRLYERTGYQIVETVTDEKENLGYYRMVKVL
jgi:ribosomal protein S18 acetylase RimI-like enzyme